MHGGSVLSTGAVVAVERVESLPEWRLVDRGVQHLRRQRVASGILPMVQLHWRGSEGKVTGCSHITLFGGKNKKIKILQITAQSRL